jgi:protoheme IX farnesyltransferase
MKPAAASVAATLRFPAQRLADYVELTKPEVTGLVVVSAFAGFYLGARGPLDWLLLWHTLTGTTLVSAGTAAFNHYLERSEDALMRRTARRPLPAGRLAPRSAFWFAAALSALGVLYLSLAVNALAGLLAFATWASYLFFYTPLKKRSVHCTTVGAFPGAMPPLIGWAAASGSLEPSALVLYAILFFWQFPHFLSIAWIYRDDYARGGLMMLPVVDPEGRATGRQVATHSVLLLGASLLPGWLGMAGPLYSWGALALSGSFLACALAMALKPSAAQARRLLQASIFYLPLLFALLMLDKT